ncbi:Alpha/Beta hydrolase protein [Bombardia bombarda]|uniref:Alpha/Beta hydrolase protein n=1 Tax=Bombardia bombarda TaxID=252184 RepID=A0AA39X1I3_9PEZI|nr:Alpha/Beta hydrolase protein [Bombardia bombarda]
MLPEPTLRFTLPSLHDSLPLDCRVYHPHSLAPSPASPSPVSNHGDASWPRHAAIVAHPYAPLGGSYDDPVVDIVANTLLRLGFLVTTFNFRGAHGSAGRTSWTAKAERADYMSVVGFVSYYTHFLDPFRSETVAFAPIRSSHPPVLLLCGYSYGAMVTSQLPFLDTILSPFNTPSCGSPAAEIRLRAQHLAETQNTVLASARAAAVHRFAGGARSPRKSLGLRVGGDEEIRKSHDSRHSFAVDAEDRICKGVAELMAKAKKGRKRRTVGGERIYQEGEGALVVPEKDQHGPAHDCLLPIPERNTPRPAYVLISPLQGTVTNFATMSFPMPFPNITWKSFTQSPSSSSLTGSQRGNSKFNSKSDSRPQAPLPDAEAKLVMNPTLAVYGDSDGFVPVRKLREWASRLQSAPDSRFQAHEVSDAGHFWAQGKAAYIMRDAVRTFAESVLLESHN